MLKTPQAKASRKIRAILKKEFPEVKFTFTAKAPLKSCEGDYPSVSVVWINSALHFEKVINSLRKHFQPLLDVLSRDDYSQDNIMRVILYRQDANGDGSFKRTYIYITEKDL